MDKILYLRDAERVIKDYFIECVNADMDAVELTEANAELCQRMEGVAFGLPGSHELQDLLCKVECIGGEELGNCPERRFGRCRSIARLESCQIHAITNYLLANGVIVLPCKVGNYIYYPWHYDDNSGVAILEVDKIVIKGETLVFILDPESDMPMPCWFSMDDFGKTVFLTKEAAEAALKAKGGGAE